ncbi:MAG TPA: phage baseplate assembly protein V, partial [Aggregatilineales bacterium]|nr:phage baseplate assembly protein V [Aggregatilineales bacterium]
MAGADRGSWFIPEPDDEVLVAFQAGDPRHPFVVGALWNGVDNPPETMDSNNNIRSITSRSGIKVTFDDTDGQVAFTIATPGGHTIECLDASTTITISDASGNSIKLEPSGITMNTSGTFSVTASTVDISASLVNVNAGMSQFSGVVKSDTNITNATVSTSYTPGAGNIW